MKGAQGLMIAAGLGVVGAVCNWFYIARKAADLEKVAFVYVKATAKVRAGDRFELEDFEKVEIPKRYLGGLEKIALRWDVRGTAAGFPATRSFTQNRILLQDDFTTPSIKKLSERLDPDQVARPVLINSTTFVQENLSPGDFVNFLPPTPRGGKGGDPLPKAGPFEVLRVGSRGGSLKVQRAGGVRSSRSNVLTVPLTVDKDGEYVDESKKLAKLIAAAEGQGLEIEILSAQRKVAPGP